MLRSHACGHLVRIALLVATASSPGIIGCVGEVDSIEGVSSVQEGVIIGNNDLVEVTRDGSNVPARYRAGLDGFGRLHIPGGLCTATHVGNGIAISAGHCFSAPSSRVDDQPCSGTSVEWGYRGGGTTSNSTCTRVLAMQTGNGLDYAIFRVSPVPAVAIGVALSSPPGNGLGLTMFSHPGGRPLTWSQTCSVLTPSSTEINYQCDTQGGSSGASVLRDDTLQVVGIHWGGGGNANAATKLTSTPLAEFLGTPPPPPPPPPTGEALVSAASGKCLDVNGAGSADGTQIQLWTCNGTGAQSFGVQDAGGGRFNLVNTSSSKCVDISNSGTANGTKVQLWTCNSTGAQAFELRDAGSGRVRLYNPGSGKCLDVTGNGTADGTKMQLWTCSNTATNQQWTRQAP